AVERLTGRSADVAAVSRYDPADESGPRASPAARRDRPLRDRRQGSGGHQAGSRPEDGLRGQRILYEHLLRLTASKKVRAVPLGAALFVCAAVLRRDRKPAAGTNLRLRSLMVSHRLFPFAVYSEGGLLQRAALLASGMATLWRSRGRHVI